MSIFNLLDSFANGTLVDDLVGGLESGIDTLERVVDGSTSAVDMASNAASNALESMVDGVEKVANVADVVADKLPE